MCRSGPDSRRDQSEQLIELTDIGLKVLGRDPVHRPRDQFTLVKTVADAVFRLHQPSDHGLIQDGPRRRGIAVHPPGGIEIGPPKLNLVVHFPAQGLDETDRLQNDQRNHRGHGYNDDASPGNVAQGISRMASPSR